MGFLQSQSDLNDKGFIFALMSRGATPGSYILGYLPVQFMWYSIMGLSIFAILTIADISVEKLWIPVFLFALT
jgi:hypothetical protein